MVNPAWTSAIFSIIIAVVNDLTRQLLFAIFSILHTVNTTYTRAVIILSIALTIFGIDKFFFEKSGNVNYCSVYM